jgi:membrane-associated HD superfamily phosphohydrolase
MKLMREKISKMHEYPLNKQSGSLGRKLGSIYAFTRSRGFARGLVIFLGSLLCLLIFTLTVTPKRYHLLVGMVPNQTIAANKDVEDELTTLYNRDAAAGAVTPIYHYRDGVTEQVMIRLDAVFAQMVAVRQYAQSLADPGPNRVYTEEEYKAARDIMNLVPFEDFQLSTLMNASGEQFDEMYASLNPAIRNTMQGNVTQGQESLAITSIMQIVGFKTNVSLLQNVVLPVLRAIVQPNMVVDAVATDAARQAAWKAVEPVIYKQGQNIVVSGEGSIRENQIAMLNSLGLLSDNSIDFAMYAGSFILVIAILTMMALFLKFFCPGVYSSVKRLLILYLTAILVLLLSFYAKSVQLIYLAPLVLPYMLLTVTIGILPAIMMGLSISLIGSLMLISAGSANVDMINLLVLSVFSGLLAALLLHRRYQRSFILIAGALLSLSGFLIILAIGLMTSMSLTNTLNKALWSLAGGAVSTLLCLSLQPAIESLFNLPTPMRLLDLTNPNHPLLRRLLLEAPGTYHHSIIIANLAEAAAEAVHANPLLARAGAYFHDIGKLKRPLYYK